MYSILLRLKNPLISPDAGLCFLSIFYYFAIYYFSVQLKEVRKSSLARLLCNVGEGVGQVVKRGFYNVGPK